MDFSNPKELSKYLLYLSENETEYDKYHEWRKDEHSLHPSFLKLLALQRPGAVETDVHAKIEVQKQEPIVELHVVGSAMSHG